MGKNLVMEILALGIELIIQALLGYLVYAFWAGYKNTRNRTLLFLAWAFGILFLLHAALSIVMEEILGYEFKAPFEPHHLILLFTLAALVYVVVGQQWRGSTVRRPLKTERGGKAA